MKDIKIFARLFKYMKPHTPMYFLSSALSSLEFLMLFATPFVNRMLVAMITGEGEPVLGTILWIMAGLIALAPIIAFGQYHQGLCVERLANNLRQTLFSHVQRLPLASLHKRQVGDYLLRVGDASQAAAIFGGYTMMSLLRFGVVTVVAMGLLFMASWPVALLAIVYNLLCFAISIKLNPVVSRLEREAKEEMAGASNRVLELTQSMPIVSIFALGARLGQWYHTKLQHVQKARVRYRMVNGLMYGVVDFFSFSAQGVGFVMSIFLLYRGNFALADAVYVASLMALTSDAMLRLSTFIFFMQRPKVASQRIFEILDEPIEAVEGTPPAPLNNTALAIHGISFTYPGATQVVFSHFNLTIAQGEHIALVGPSGGGKTTLAQLMAGLYTPDAGHIAYFGHTDLTPGQVRKLIAYVPQVPVLFDGTLGENILQGNPQATWEAVTAAATQAGLAHLPLSTPVGAQGANISGGERQRVAIARALIKNAPILILDEATSALDAATEETIKTLLESLDCTRITIAHRPATVAGADRVVEVGFS